MTKLLPKSSKQIQQEIDYWDTVARLRRNDLEVLEEFFLPTGHPRYRTDWQTTHVAMCDASGRSHRLHVDLSVAERREMEAAR